MIKVAYPDMEATFDIVTGTWVSSSKDFAMLLNSTIPFGGFSPSDGSVPEAALDFAKKALPSLQVIKHTGESDRGGERTIY